VIYYLLKTILIAMSLIYYVVYSQNFRPRYLLGKKYRFLIYMVLRSLPMVKLFHEGIQERGWK